MKVYVVHSNEVLPMDMTYNKVELVTSDREKAVEKLRECIQEWKDDYKTMKTSRIFKQEETEDTFSAWADGDYNNDHYDVEITETDLELDTIVSENKC